MKTVRTMRRRKKKRIGARLAALVLLAAAVVAPLAGQKDKKQKQGYAVVAGTVFREPGLALPGAEIMLTADPAPPKFKPMKTTSDGRGEYAFHVPAREARYTLKVKAAGYGPEQKEASVSGEQRVDVFFQLKPAAR